MLRRIGKYELIEAVGTGGFGSVYRALDSDLQRDVAIKILHASASRDRSYVETLRKEAAAAASLEPHPNVAMVYTFEVDDDVPFIVMQYVSGSLQQRLESSPVIPVSEAIAIAQQICDALSHIHRNLIHRDLKPANILLDEDGVVKVTDFGLARETTSSTRVSQSAAAGTYPYMPHEQIYGDRVGKNADIYALGVVLYEMLTGELPFVGQGPIDWYNKHKNDSVPEFPESLALPDTLYQLVCKALEKNPANRYADAGEMQAALAGIAETLKVREDPAAKAREAFGRGEVLRRRQDEHQKAIDHYTEAIRLQPDYPVALYRRGTLYSRHSRPGRNDIQKAIDDFTEAIRFRPNFPEAFVSRGDCHYRILESEKAVEDYTEAIRLRPSYHLAFNRRGIRYRDLREYQKAVDDHTEAIRFRPDYPYALYSRAEAWECLREYQKAVDDYTEVIRLRPDYPYALYSRAQAWERLGEHQKALDDYGEAIRLRPNEPEPFLDRALAYAESGEPQKAIDDYGEAIRLGPNEPDPFLYRAELYSRLREYQKAIDDYTEVIHLGIDEWDFGPFYSRGEIYLQLGEYQKAIDDYTEVIPRFGEPADSIFNKRGTIYDRLGDFEKAIDDYTEAIRQAPHVAGYYRNRAMSYIALGMGVNADEDTAKADELSS